MTSNPPNAGASLDQLRERVRSQFVDQFHESPKHFAVAPGRVNLIGEHIDYNDGFVLPMAIERYVLAAGGENPSTGEADIVVHSIETDSTACFRRDDPALTGPDAWASYVQGVAHGFWKLGIDLPKIRITLASDVPIGGGLSSSAALEVAVATLLEAVSGTTLDPYQKADLCVRAEHEFAGVPCGTMDQLSSVFGERNAFLLIDCQRSEIRPVPFLAGDVTILIINSNVRHELAGGEYAQRRAECQRALAKLEQPSWRDVDESFLDQCEDRLTAAERRRARHVVSEIFRTMASAVAMESSDWNALGQLMFASHRSLRDDYEVSCDELDLLVEIARDLGPSGGVLGSRMTGGGFGGCTVTLARTDAAQEVGSQIARRYQQATGRTADFFISRPARGAHLLS